MEKKLIHLDDLVYICGYFTSHTYMNNGYGCNHPGCSEYAYMYQNEDDLWAGDTSRFSRDEIIEKIIKRMFRKKINSNRLLRKAKKKYKRLLDDESFFNLWLKKLGMKRQGACFSFSCPIAYEADLLDMEELDLDVYNEWKDAEKEPSYYGSEWMVYDEKKEL